jgi:hypothetical protein
LVTPAPLLQDYNLLIHRIEGILPFYLPWRYVTHLFVFLLRTRIIP